MKHYHSGLILGDFDVFRARHLNVLMQAREWCDHLLVGVYTDEFVFGQTLSSPLIPYHERSQIVESVRFVDRVIPVSGFDLEAVRREYPFDVVLHDSEEEIVPQWHHVQNLLKQETACPQASMEGENKMPDGCPVIGYTTGTYDLFHIGHLNILRRARTLCDYLIVGVSTDELVRNYKHRQPVYPQEERMQIIRSLKFVDKVVEQASLDKMDAWRAFHFNVMFHGDDWKGSSLYNRIEEDLKTVGCEIVYLPHTEGVSSSAIRSHIR